MTLKETKVLESTNEEKNAWDHGRKTAINYLFRNLLLKTKNRKKVLNIGSSSDWILQGLLKTKEGDLYSVPVNETKFQGNNQQTVTRFASIEEMVKEVNAPLDIVLVVDVIENLTDDIGFLKWLLTYEVITSKTKIIVSSTTLEKGGIFNKKALRAYKREMLCHYVNRAGLEVKSSGCFFALGLLLNKFKIKAFCKPKKELNKYVFYFLKGLLEIDFFIGVLFRFFKISLPGDTCYVVCKKT